MLKKIISGILILGTITTISGCAYIQPKNTNTETKTVTKSEKITYTNITEDGAFYFNGNKIISPMEAKSDKILNWYFDPNCPACVALDSIIKKDIPSILDNKAIIKYYPSAVLGENSTSNYSAIASSYILAVVEKDSEKAMEFIHNVMNPTTLEKFRNNEIPNIPEYFKTLYSGSKWDEINSIRNNTIITVLNHSKTIKSTDILSSRSFNKELYVPFLYINDGKSLDIFTSGNPVQDLKNALK